MIMYEKQPGFYFRVDGVKIVVPEYILMLPQIKVSDSDALTYTKFTGDSRLVVEAAMQTAAFQGAAYSAKWYLKYWAKWYYRRWPELRQSNGTLKGFDPIGLMQYFWVGEDSRTGKAKSHIRSELIQWATKAKNRNTSATQD
jgi:hypothetical protein